MLKALHWIHLRIYCGITTPCEATHKFPFYFFLVPICPSGSIFLVLNFEFASCFWYFSFTYHQFFLIYTFLCSQLFSPSLMVTTDHHFFLLNFLTHRVYLTCTFLFHYSLTFFFWCTHFCLVTFPPLTYENNRSLFYPSSSLSLFCLYNISSPWYYLCFLWKFRHSFLTLISAISVQHFVLHNLMMYGDIFLI